MFSPTETTKSNSSGNNSPRRGSAPGVTVTKNCHLDMSGMNDLLSETDKDTEYMRAWVAIRNRQQDEDGEDSVDLIDDDASLDYLADAVSDFFRKIFFCGFASTPSQTQPITTTASF